MTVTKELIESKLKESLNPVHIEVKDTSGGCGQSFEVLIVSDKFHGKSLLNRHRLVNDILESEIKEIHAFSQKAKTPQEWEASK